MLNTYGLKMIGLKKVSGQTYDYGYYSGEYVEIFYDTKTGEVWTKYQYSLGHNSWTQYHDPSIIKICNASGHLTMQAIADLIRDAVEKMDYYETCV